MAIKFIFTTTTWALRGDELGCIIPSSSQPSTVFWMNVRSASLKRRDFVAIGFTPEAKLENNNASLVSAIARAQFDSLTTTKSGAFPLNSKMSL